MLESLVSYLRNKGKDYNKILKEMEEIQHYKSQGRSKYSSMMIIKKCSSGTADSIKVATFLLEKNTISFDFLLLVDEMYLKKSVQYHRGYSLDQDEEGNLYKGIVIFMIVSLKQSISHVVKSRPEVSINGEWLKIEIEECILNLKETGFKVREVIADDHSANVNAFSHLLNRYDGDKKFCIYHPVNNRLFKTYLFFAIIYLIENIRNNLFSRKNLLFYHLVLHD